LLEGSYYFDKGLKADIVFQILVAGHLLNDYDLGIWNKWLSCPSGYDYYLKNPKYHYNPVPDLIS